MGRHREFDVEKVLDAALCVFWRKGYEGASYADLTEAAGVERPALYSAFGNKEALFRRALARYEERYVSHMPAALALPTAREVTAHILYSAADLNTRYRDHPGCFGINGALAVSDEAEPVRQALIDFRAAGQARLRERFERAKAEGAQAVVVSAAIEAEIVTLEAEDRAEFLSDLGLSETGLTRVIRAGYELLHLLTFFTAGPKEARAWTIPAGSKAPQAAGAIHSDFERGFIRAETIAFADFIACKGEAGARDAGKLRSEGKEYVVQDGDVLHFKFNV